MKSPTCGRTVSLIVPGMSSCGRSSKMPETRESTGRRTVESAGAGAACARARAVATRGKKITSNRRSMVWSGQQLEAFKRQPNEQALLQHVDRHHDALWVRRIVDVALEAVQRAPLDAHVGAFPDQRVERGLQTGG